ncbi:hypothetical protein EV179_006337, partial [Coemansia sp. RSA 487]
EFDMGITYRSGYKDVVADGMSCSVVSQPDKIIEINDEELQTLFTTALSSSAMAHVKLVSDADIDELTQSLEQLQLCALSLPVASGNCMEIVLLDERTTLPYKVYEDDAGFDVCCYRDFKLAPKDRYLVPLGFSARAPIGTHLRITQHNGLAKNGIEILAGIVDDNYRGGIKA